ncbi:hypothetical protein HK102_012014, partial [Quaeritorhiza haematococci]
MGRPELGVTLTKLHVWNPEVVGGGVRKVAFLDADTVVLGNVDEIFEYVWDEEDDVGGVGLADSDSDEGEGGAGGRLGADGFGKNVTSSAGLMDGDGCMMEGLGGTSNNHRVQTQAGIIPRTQMMRKRPVFAAAPDQGWPDCFNSGVFVCKPDGTMFERLCQFAKVVGSFD